MSGNIMFIILILFVYKVLRFVVLKVVLLKGNKVNYSKDLNNRTE